MASLKQVSLALLTPMPEEAVSLSQAMEHPQRLTLAGLTAHVGDLAGRRCILVECGIGKIAAAAAAQALCAQRIRDGILVLGIAGGVAPEVHLGDILIATQTAQHDLDVRPFFPRFVVPHLDRSVFDADEMLHRRALSAARAVAAGLTGARPGVLARMPPRVHIGMVLTGDQVIGPRRRRESLRRAFPESLGVDMETAAVAQVCYQNETPWAAVRVISDGLNDRINPTQVLDYASSTATTVLRDIILHMLGAPDDV